MTEIILLGIFSAALLACILSGASILFALIFGLMIFSFYAAELGHAPRKIFGMWKEGVRPIKPILITLVLIGIITAYWRAAGVIPAIIFYTADFDDILALRINFDIDRHSVWHGGNDGNNLRVDSGKFRRTDLVDGRRDFVGLLFW